MMSTTTIVLRRSNRSAKAPASGPSTIAGSSRKSSTPPRAKLAAAKPLTSDVAVAVIASRPEPVAEARQRHRQPQLAEVADPQHRAQLGDQPDRPQRAVGRAVDRGPSGDRSVRRHAATGGRAAGRPPAARPPAGCAPPVGPGGGAGGVGSDGIGTPGVGGGEVRPSAAFTVPGGSDGFPGHLSASAMPRLGSCG